MVSTKTKYKGLSEAPFRDEYLSTKMSTKQREIDDLLKSLLYEPHPTRSETTAEQATMYSGSNACVSRELDDEEMWEEMGSGLLKEDRLSREELRRATIEGTIRTTIAYSGASTTCLQPIEEQAQESECGKYRWDPPFISTGKKSSKVFQMARGDTAPGAEVVQLQGLTLRQETATGHTVIVD